MSARKHLLEIISHYTRIVVTRPNIPLAVEIFKQLKQYNYVQLKTASDAAPESLNEKFEVLIHLVGFDKKSLAETVFHTSYLHQLLDKAIANKAKFILILPEPPDALKETAISLVTQFGKIFKLDYRIVVVEPKADLSTTAEEIIKTFIHNHKIEKITEPLPVSKPQHKLHPEKNKRSPLARFLVIAGLLVAIYLANLLAVYGLLRCAIGGLSIGVWSQVTSCSRPAKTLVRLMDPLSFSREGRAINEMADSLEKIGEWGSAGLKMSDPQKYSEWKQLGIGLSDRLAYLEQQLTVLPNLFNASRNITFLRTVVAKLNLVSDSLYLLVTKPNVTVLVLIQDNTELRPSGGYLGNIALITVSAGKVSSIDFYTTESLDNLLRGQVAPPADFELATGQSQWFLRDSNWSPDFAQSGERAAWFVGKELGQQVDYVVGINLAALERLLALANADSNLQSKHLEAIQKNSGSDYIGDAARMFADQFKGLPFDRKQQIAFELIKLIEERQVLVTSFDDRSKSWSLAGWDGSTRLNACSDCVADMFYVVDSNVGVNKANYYLETEQDMTLAFSQGLLEADWHVVYKNQSLGSSWPAGDYHNYLRLGIPKDYTLKELTVDGQRLSNEQIQLQTDDQFRWLGTKILVKAGSSLAVNLKLSRSYSQSEVVRYSLLLPNQPGRLGLQTDINLTVPADWVVDYRSPGLVASGSRFTYNTNLLAPETLNLVLKPNYGN